MLRHETHRCNAEGHTSPQATFPRSPSRNKLIWSKTVNPTMSAKLQNYDKAPFHLPEVRTMRVRDGILFDNGGDRTFGCLCLLRTAAIIMVSLWLQSLRWSLRAIPSSFVGQFSKHRWAEVNTILMRVFHSERTNLPRLSANIRGSIHARGHCSPAMATSALCKSRSHLWLLRSQQTASCNPPMFGIGNGCAGQHSILEAAVCDG